MNSLIKIVLLHSIVLNIPSIIYSTELNNNSSLFVNVSEHTDNNNDTSGMLPSINFDSSLLCIPNNSNITMESQQIKDQNIDNNNIYNPSIFAFINKKQINNTNINNDPGFICLHLNELCSINANIYNEYLVFKNTADICLNDIKKFCNSIKELENKYKINNVQYNKYDTNNNNMKQYINNSLQDIIKNKQQQMRNITHIKNELLNIKSSTTIINIDKSIENCISISNQLLAYTNKQYQYETYIDDFRLRMNNIFNQHNEWKLNKNTKVEKSKLKNCNKINTIEELPNQQAILNNFNSEHNKLINILNNKINTLNNNINKIVQKTIEKMQSTNSFLFTIDDKNCIIHSLLEEIIEIQNTMTDSYKSLIHAETRIYRGEDKNFYERVAKRELNDRSRMLITKPVNKLLNILNKTILFNCNDNSMIKEVQEIINNMKNKLTTYIE